MTVAGTSPYQALGPGLLGVHQVLPLEPLLQTLISSGVAEPFGKNFWSGFEEVFLFFKEKDESLQEKLASDGGLKVHSPAKPFSEFLKEGRWAAEYWLETVLHGPFPFDSPFRQAKLLLDGTHQDRGKTILDSFGISSPLVIHPGSGSPEKNSPLPFFRNAAEKAVAESQKQVLVVWGEAEEKRAGEIQKAFEGLKGVYVLKEPLPLLDLVAVLSRSAAYLGNDSGVTQLAAACGVRTFAVFNSTDSRVWGPQEAVILAAVKNLTQ